MPCGSRTALRGAPVLTIVLHIAVLLLDLQSQPSAARLFSRLLLHTPLPQTALDSLAVSCGSQQARRPLWISSVVLARSLLLCSFAPSLLLRVSVLHKASSTRFSSLLMQQTLSMQNPLSSLSISAVSLCDRLRRASRGRFCASTAFSQVEGAHLMRQMRVVYVEGVPQQGAASHCKR
jgi:hypothetical protein